MTSDIPTFKLTIEYDGSAYHGWQSQPDGRTIQQTIEAALATMTDQCIRITGSGRTDAGVHALGQTAHFQCHTKLTADIFQKGLNSLLPDDIVILACESVPSWFHARFDAVSKRYRYCIDNRPVPMAIGRHYNWYVRPPLDIEAMGEAAGRLVGQHDFKAFEGAGSPRAHTIRHLLKAEVSGCSRSDIRIEVTADGFLRYMVRNIVGTLVDVGLGKTSAGQVETILQSGQRRLAGATAPAQGLFLVEVNY